MENTVKKRHEKRYKRALRVRKHLRGTQDRPRLSVMKSNHNLSVQLIDDERGITLASIGTLSKALKAKKLGKNKESARVIGEEIARIAKEKNIQSAVFDRGYYRYHGVIAQLADAARAGGLQF